MGGSQRFNIQFAFLWGQLISPEQHLLLLYNCNSFLKVFYLFLMCWVFISAQAFLVVVTGTTRWQRSGSAELLTVVASVAEHRLRARERQQLRNRGTAAPQRGGSPQARDSTGVPCTARPVPNH